MQATSPYTKRLFLGTSLLVLLFLIPTLVACGSSNNPSSSGSTPTPLSTAGQPGTGGSTPSVTLGALLGVQPCPGATKNASYWNNFIIPTSGVSSVESVSCANIIGNPSLQALVTVRHRDTGTPLDIYVFNNITNATPTRVFRTYGLVKGDANGPGRRALRAQRGQTRFRYDSRSLPRVQVVCQCRYTGADRLPWHLSRPDALPGRIRPGAGQSGTPTLETQCDHGRERPGRELAQLVYQFLNHPSQRRWTA